jgi:phage FluMu protein Com
VIKFRCKNCGKKINAPEKHVGKKGKCPKCKTVLVVPQPDNRILDESKSGSKTLTLIPPGSDISTKQEIQKPLIEWDNTFEKTVEEAEDFKDELEEDHTESPGKRKLPWPLDIFLYPISTPGLTILAIIIGIPLVFRIVVMLLSILMLRFPPLLVLFALFACVGFIVRIVMGLYLYWYFCECIRDSAVGGLRAPETMGGTPGLADMFWQMIRVVGCFAFFFVPTLIYFLHTRKIDIVFWSLLAYGVFFFPMGLLAVIMFDSFAGLNPLLLIPSIFSTFFQYCGLIMLFGFLSFLFIKIVSILPRSLISGFILGIFFIYLLIVSAHLLGRFYFRYQEKLYWEV